MNWIDMFKVRYSWGGKAGNDNFKDASGNDMRFSYLYTIATRASTVYNFGGDFGYDRAYSGKYYSVISSPYVSWEVATKQDLGLDFSFLGDRFSGTIDYFHEKRDDVFQERNYLPWSVGVESSPWANIGKVKAYGFDGTSPTSRK